MGLCKNENCTNDADFGQYCVYHTRSIYRPPYRRTTRQYPPVYISGEKSCKYCACKQLEGSEYCIFHKYIMELPFEQCTERMKRQICNEIRNHYKGKCQVCNKNKADMVIRGSNGISTKVMCKKCSYGI